MAKPKVVKTKRKQVVKLTYEICFDELTPEQSKQELNNLFKYAAQFSDIIVQDMSNGDSTQLKTVKQVWVNVDKFGSWMDEKLVE